MNVTVVDFPAIRGVGRRHLGPYHLVGPVFDAVGAWCTSQGYCEDGMRIFGFSWDDPARVPADELRYDIVFTMSRRVDPGPDNSWIEVEGGTYAMFLHRGPYSELPGAFARLLTEWLPTTNFQLRDGPCVEEYFVDVDHNDPSTWRVLIGIPIR